MKCPDNLESKLCILLATRSMDFFDSGRFNLCEWDKYLSELEIIRGIRKDSSNDWDVYVPSGSWWWVHGHHSIPKIVAEKALLLGGFPCKNP